MRIDIFNLKSQIDNVKSNQLIKIIILLNIKRIQEK